jgi:hypothetical protein
MVDVRGRILSPDGTGVPSIPIRLFKTRRSLQLGKFSSGGQVSEATRVLTDENGFFELRIPRDRSYDDYFLRFHGPDGFDSVKYRPPADREITRDLKRGEPLILEVELAYQPDWPEVMRRAEAVGEESAQGKILRSLGLPEREMNGLGPGGPREEWWYHTRGVVYFFREGQAAGFRRFEPVRVGEESGGV